MRRRLYHLVKSAGPPVELLARVQMRAKRILHELPSASRARYCCGDQGGAVWRVAQAALHSVKWHPSLLEHAPADTRVLFKPACVEASQVGQCKGTRDKAMQQKKKKKITSSLTCPRGKSSRTRRTVQTPPASRLAALQCSCSPQSDSTRLLQQCRSR